jgi:hypothetical protein
MSDADDQWPLPRCSAGPREHLHAFGVISTVFNSFEESLYSLFQHHFDVRGVPFDVGQFFWVSLKDKAAAGSKNQAPDRVPKMQKRHLY